MKEYEDARAIHRLNSVLPIRRKKSRKPQKMEILPPASLGNILQPILEETEMHSVSEPSERTKLELELIFRDSEMKLIKVTCHGQLLVILLLCLS